MPDLAMMEHVNTTIILVMLFVHRNEIKNMVRRIDKLEDKV